MLDDQRPGMCNWTCSARRDTMMRTSCLAQVPTLDETAGHLHPPCPEDAATDDDNMSIAGEEDPGAALDTSGFAPAPG